MSRREQLAQACGLFVVVGGMSALFVLKGTLYPGWFILAFLAWILLSFSAYAYLVVRLAHRARRRRRREPRAAGGSASCGD